MFFFYVFHMLFKIALKITASMLLNFFHGFVDFVQAANTLLICNEEKNCKKIN